jgi:hypothetical protein
VALPSAGAAGPAKAEVSAKSAVVDGPPVAYLSAAIWQRDADVQRHAAAHHQAKAAPRQAAKPAQGKATRGKATQGKATSSAKTARHQAKASADAASSRTPSGSPQQIAQQMLGQFGWSTGQFSCLDPLWGHESGWSVTASNPSSGAYGIAQALPGSRMASAGSDWPSDAATQIKWGLQYIQSTYGSPCGAWSHEESDGWY